MFKVCGVLLEELGSDVGKYDGKGEVVGVGEGEGVCVTTGEYEGKGEGVGDSVGKAEGTGDGEALFNGEAVGNFGPYIDPWVFELPATMFPVSV